MFEDPEKIDSREIRKRLIKEFKDENYIDSILEQFWFRDWYNTLVSYEPYLELLQKYLKHNKVKSFNRLDFYKYVFDQILGGEDTEDFSTIQKLAVAFEKMHTDRIPADELEKLLKKLKLDSKTIQKYLKKEILFEIKTVQENGDDKEYFIWKHHTLSEYFSARLLLNEKNLLASLDNYLLYKEDDFIAFKNSWYGTLRFLIESDQSKEVVNWLYEIGKENPDNVDNDYSQIILTADPNKIGELLSSKIFELIYKEHQKKIIWLPVYTRKYIGKFFLEKHFKLLEKDIKQQKSPVTTYVHRGNVVSVIDSLFENNSKLLTEKRKSFWKEKFIEFANDKNDNGVLQRHSLSALTHYKDKSTIQKVSSAFKHDDSLVKQAFIEFCYEVAPNEQSSIDFFVKAIKEGMTIYGRHGLYHITTTDGLTYLFKKFNEEDGFFEAFVDKESIFSNKEEGGDQQIIDKFKSEIDKESGKALLDEAKKMIAYPSDDIKRHYIGRSVFLQKIASIVAEKDSDFVTEFLIGVANIRDEQKQHNTIFNIEVLFPYLLTSTVARKIKSELKKPSDRYYRELTGSFYVAERKNGDIGKKAYETAVEIGLIEPLVDVKLSLNGKEGTVFDREMDQLRDYLRPEGKKYLIGVFEYFVQTHKNTLGKLTKREKQKIENITEDVLAYDPRKIKLRINSRGGNSNFTWTNVASYYGDVIATAEIIKPSLIEKYRQNIINFIPFAFSSDQATLSRVLNGVTDDELEFVYSAYNGELENKDLRYFLPSSFVYVISSLCAKGSEITNAKDILLSFAGDKEISEHYREASLEKLHLFLNEKDKEALEIIKELDKQKDSDDKVEKRLAVLANEILITVYKDESAISRRFEELERRAFPYDRKKDKKFHWVGPEENELRELSFASPLIRLKDPKYIPQFISLLDGSLEILRKKKDQYWSYVDYLWKVCISYFDELKSIESIEPYLVVKNWAEKNVKGDKSNWFESRLHELRIKYVDYLSKKKI